MVEKFYMRIARKFSGNRIKQEFISLSLARKLLFVSILPPDRNIFASDLLKEDIAVCI